MKYAVFFAMLLTATACGTSTDNSGAELSATEIMQRAHEVAGGKFWQQPTSLTLKGHAKFYRDSIVQENERHNMWRVFTKEKEAAHQANGKVRIESFHEGKPFFVVTFDGTNTYDRNGKQEPSAADQRWASNFGYGAIRHAFDPGYSLERAGLDTVKSKSTYLIKVIDPQDGETTFGIEEETFHIVKVAFDTPRGWHERIYSDFFSKEEYDWLQSGRVELYYGGVLANEVFWDDFEVNEQLPDSLFVLTEQENNDQ